MEMSNFSYEDALDLVSSDKDKSVKSLNGVFGFTMQNNLVLELAVLSQFRKARNLEYWMDLKCIRKLIKGFKYVEDDTLESILNSHFVSSFANGDTIWNCEFYF